MGRQGIHTVIMSQRTDMSAAATGRRADMRAAGVRQRMNMGAAATGRKADMSAAGVSLRTDMGAAATGRRAGMRAAGVSLRTDMGAAATGRKADMSTAGVSLRVIMSQKAGLPAAVMSRNMGLPVMIPGRRDIQAGVLVQTDRNGAESSRKGKDPTGRPGLMRRITKWQKRHQNLKSPKRKRRKSIAC